MAHFLTAIDKFPHALQRVEKLAKGITGLFHTIEKVKVQFKNVAVRPPFKEHYATPTFSHSLVGIAGKNEADFTEGVNSLILGDTKQVVTLLSSGLETLAKKQMVGEIVYPADGTAAYSDHVWEVEDKAVRVRSNGQVQQTDLRRTLKLRTTYSELSNAHWHHIRETTLAKPAEVQAVINAIPTELDQFAKIVDGDEIFRSVVDELIHSEERTEVKKLPVPVVKNLFRPDPAVILFGYLLISW